MCLEFSDQYECACAFYSNWITIKAFQSSSRVCVENLPGFDLSIFCLLHFVWCLSLFLSLSLYHSIFFPPGANSNFLSRFLPNTEQKRNSGRCVYWSPWLGLRHDCVFPWRTLWLLSKLREEEHRDEKKRHIIQTRAALFILLLQSIRVPSLHNILSSGNCGRRGINV